MWPIRIALSKFRPVGPSLAVRLTVVGSLFILFLWGDYEIFRRLFRAAAQIEAVTPFFAVGLIENFLGLVFLIAMMTLFFSAMTTAIGTLFTDSDLELYHGAPVPRSRILGGRWIATLIQSAYLVVFFLLPMFVALAAQYEQGLGFLLVSALDLLMLVSIPVSIAAAVILLLVRFFPVQRVHQISATLAIIVLTLAIVGIRMARPERLFTEVTTDELKVVLSAIRMPASNLWPSHWLGEATASRILGEAAMVPSGRIASLAAVCFVLFLGIGTAGYYIAWVRSRESSSPMMIGAGPLTRFLDRMTRRFDHRTRAMFGKEVRTVTRDATQWSQMFMMLALLFIYLYNIQMMPLEGDFRAALLAWLNLGMCGFVISAVGLRFAYPSMSAEGKQFWVLLSAPISMRRLLWVKTTVYLVPLVALSVMLTVLANILLDASSVIWAYTVIASAVISGTLVAMGVGLGAITPDFRSDNPVEVALSLGGFAYMSLSLLYVGSMMFLFARPVQRFIVRMVFGVELDRTIWTIAAPILIGLAVSLVLAVLPLEIARVRLQRELA